MPKPNKHATGLSNINELTHEPVRLSTAENGSVITPPTKAQVSLLMAELGRKGGKIGGKRRLETMTDDQRKRVARKAARIRWERKKVS